MSSIRFSSLFTVASTRPGRLPGQHTEKTMTISRELPKYQCHKKVWALKIKAVAQGTQPTDLPGGSWMLHPADDGYGPLEVSHEWYAKHKPEAGGYFVVYDDGYKPYSPAAAFESGYSLIG